MPSSFIATPAAHAAALWTGLSLFLLLVLSMLVVRQRRAHGVLLGDGGTPSLMRASRAFGNAIEYVPALIGALAVLAMVGAQAWLVHVIGATLVLGRIAHAVGLSRSEGVSIGRAAGTLLTWLAYLLAGVVLLIYAAP